MLVVQAHSKCYALREELGEQVDNNWEERKRFVVGAVPCVAPFRVVDNSLTPCGWYAARG